MEKTVNVKTVCTLTQKELKQAVCEYMKQVYSEDFKIDEIHLEAEMSSPEQFGQVTVTCSRNVKTS